MLAKGEYAEEEIAVVTGSISSYEQSISREFDRAGIRYFLDNKKNIGANWIAEYIQSVLEMYRYNMDAATTFRFLRCGLSPLTRSETDLLENYVLATGKRGIASYMKPWRARANDYPLEEINEIREKVTNCIHDFFLELRGGKSRSRNLCVHYMIFWCSRMYMTECWSRAGFLKKREKHFLPKSIKMYTK